MIVDTACGIECTFDGDSVDAKFALHGIYVAHAGCPPREPIWLSGTTLPPLAVNGESPRVSGHAREHVNGTAFAVDAIKLRYCDATMAVASKIEDNDTMLDRMSRRYAGNYRRRIAQSSARESGIRTIK